MEKLNNNLDIAKDIVKNLTLSKFNIKPKILLSKRRYCNEYNLIFYGKNRNKLIKSLHF